MKVYLNWVWIHSLWRIMALDKIQKSSIFLIIIIIIEHRWLQARVPGSSPGGDSQFCLRTFPVCLFPSNQLIFYDFGLPAC